MESIIDIEEIEGKIIKATYHDDSDLVLRFTDGTFIAFCSRLGYEDSHYIEINEEPETYLLRNVGVITLKEYAEINRREEQSRKDQKEASDKRLYEELKRKYDTP